MAHGGMDIGRLDILRRRKGRNRVCQSY